MATARNLLAELGLSTCPPVFRDWQFLAALAAGVPVVLGLWLLLPHGYAAGLRHQPLVLFSLVIWQPVIEELFFRGLIQGQLARYPWARHGLFGVSRANLITSIAFAAAHLVGHPPLWAAAVFVPSLVYGHFRERHASVYPAMILHAGYNAGYFAAGLL